MGQHNIIELNGKRYDAITGALLGESRIKTTPATRGMAAAHRSRTIDGFVRGSKTTGHAPTIIKPTAVAPTMPVPSKASPGKKMDIQRMPKALKAHQPERPKTLMRHAVNKPKTDMKPAIKTAAPTEMMARPVSTLARQLEKKLSVTQVNPVRLAHAKHVARSHHIRRFSHGQRQHDATVNAHATAQAAARLAPAAQPVTSVRKMSYSAALAKAEQQLAARQKHADIFEAALAHAVSHEQLPPKHVKRRSSTRKRLVNMFAGVAAFLVIGGFVAYLNMPALELQVASVRAGFRAEMPGYQPTGYALNGGIQSSKGKVSMEFRSGDSAYKVVQEVSDWNSATLLDQKSAELGAPAETIQSKGRIIYIYGTDNATWVNGGVRYEISGNASLDTNELVSLATSM